jgi:cellulose synthase/poly-beta-1,6-N-acetylglucosamine synthase-like glycosyltransferase
MTQPRLTILVTAYWEATTIGRALDALLPQLTGSDDQVIVVCPDDDTAQAASRHAGVTILRDPGSGKPAALNLGLGSAHGDLILMTDGDVWIDAGAVAALTSPFSDPTTGAVSGRPISVSPRDKMLGYWSHLLTDAGAHRERAGRDSRGEFLVCSGYLYAVRAGLVGPIPEDALAEDAVVSQMVAEQGYRIRYTPDAKVFVHYPETYRDWLIQKVRSTGGYAQSVVTRSPHQMRSFRHEAAAGLWPALTYARTPRELAWTILLMAARLHLWLLIFWRVRVLREPLTRLWQRVESTKG